MLYLFAVSLSTAFRLSGRLIEMMRIGLWACTVSEDEKGGSTLSTIILSGISKTIRRFKKLRSPCVRLLDIADWSTLFDKGRFAVSAIQF